jgi:hypothetical protein
MTTLCTDCLAPATLLSEHDDAPRCAECDRDEERRVERQRGTPPDAEHCAAMRQLHFGEER